MPIKNPHKEQKVWYNKAMKIYLDNCCYNRPYDDQSYLNVSLETQAKLRVQEEIRAGKHELIQIADDSVVRNAKEIMKKGIKNKDALHIASAIAADCDVFLTVDRKLLKTPVDGIKTVSPMDFLNYEEEAND